MDFSATWSTPLTVFPLRFATRATHAAEGVHHGDDADATPLRQGIVDKVHGPPLVHRPEHRTLVCTWHEIMRVAARPERGRCHAGQGCPVTVESWLSCQRPCEWNIKSNCSRKWRKVDLDAV